MNGLRQRGYLLTEFRLAQSHEQNRKQHLELLLETIPDGLRMSVEIAEDLHGQHRCHLHDLIVQPRFRDLDLVLQNQLKYGGQAWIEHQTLEVDHARVLYVASER